MSESIKTKRLYYEDCYQKTFEAVVAGVGKDGTGRYILLDQTQFFPEGGGQPADLGMINDSAVKDVQIVKGEIRHYTDGDFANGDTVKGVIDWERRFDLMQQHSGEHIVSGRIHARFGYDNVGFHMGEKFITIDLNGEIDNEQLSSIEAEVNEYIWKDKEVKTFFASDEDVITLPYRSKLELEGEVRLVEFPGADLCACCGLHVDRAGEIGLVKLVSVHRFRQGVRIEMLSGKRAFEYLNSHFGQNSRIAVGLSAKPENTWQAVGRLLEEAFQLRGEILKLEKEKYLRIAGMCADCGDVLLLTRNLNPADIRKCADEILNVCGGICVLMSGDDEAGYRYAAGIRDGDIRELVKAMNQDLSGRGGGKPFFAQGSLKGCRTEVEAFFKKRNFTIFTKV